MLHRHLRSVRKSLFCAVSSSFLCSNFPNYWSIIYSLCKISFRFHFEQSASQEIFGVLTWDGNRQQLLGKDRLSAIPDSLTLLDYLKKQVGSPELLFEVCQVQPWQYQAAPDLPGPALAKGPGCREETCQVLPTKAVKATGLSSLERNLSKSKLFNSPPSPLCLRSASSHTWQFQITDRHCIGWGSKVH